jgi:hypothetical protein
LSKKPCRRRRTYQQGKYEQQEIDCICLSALVGEDCLSPPKVLVAQKILNLCHPQNILKGLDVLCVLVHTQLICLFQCSQIVEDHQAQVENDDGSRSQESP